MFNYRLFVKLRWYKSCKMLPFQRHVSETYG